MADATVVNNGQVGDQTSNSSQNQQIPANIAPTSSNVRLFVNQDICIQCQTCVMMHPQYFEARSDGTVHEIGDGSVPADQANDIMSVCPSSAINKKM